MMTERQPMNLSDNTNRWGAPPHARAALHDWARDPMRYPEPFARALVEELAAYHDVSADRITTGNGGDGTLSASVRALTRAGDVVAIPVPTFGMVAEFASAHGAGVAAVARRPDYELDVDAIVATRARLVYVCSPNNPTGTMTPSATIADLARGVDGVVLVDAAYADFAPDDRAGLLGLLALDNVVVVRTMSKAFGLAGARVGYAIGPVALTQAIERVRGPYAVNAGGAVAAVAALRSDVAWVREHASLASVNRDGLVARLRALGGGLEPVASQANFVFVPLRDAPIVARAMAEAGVVVRAFTDLPPVSPALAASSGGALRITVGPWHEMEAALDALDGALVLAGAAP